ncbi:MAG: uroporphyrinogen-III synthase [Chlamydiia bacterium]|nr:uroporphyrinogen-III synthase [Chlamydiia bacterium]
MTVLYTGTDPSNFYTEKPLIHCPLIKIVPRSFQERKIQVVFEDLPKYTHLVFTSKNAVPIFFDFVQQAGYKLEDTKALVIAVGKATAEVLKQFQFKVDLIAKDEHQEGIIAELEWLDLENAYFLLPKSSLSRPELENYLIRRSIRFQACDLYDTETHKPSKLPNLDEVDEIVFTSPSTVLAFLQIFSAIPKDKKITPVGPVTARALLRSP